MKIYATCRAMLDVVENVKVGFPAETATTHEVVTLLAGEPVALYPEQEKTQAMLQLIHNHNEVTLALQVTFTYRSGEQVEHTHHIIFCDTETSPLNVGTAVQFLRSKFGNTLVDPSAWLTSEQYTEDSKSRAISGLKVLVERIMSQQTTDLSEIISEKLK